MRRAGFSPPPLISSSCPISNIMSSSAERVPSPGDYCLSVLRQRVGILTIVSELRIWPIFLTQRVVADERLDDRP